MLRFGVYTADQYVKPDSAWRCRSHADYRLLRTAIPPSAVETAVFDELSREMQLANGIFRTTSPDRFQELDRWLTPILAEYFSAELELQLEDWAASNCITSVAWYEACREAFPRLRLTASDVNLYLLEMHDGEGGVYVLEANGCVLQFLSPPFVVRLFPVEPRRLWVNRILARRARTRLAKLCSQNNLDPSAIQFPEGVDEIRRGPVLFRKIPLIHPQAIAFSLAHPAFRIERHSVFEAAPHPAHVIRTMNILNTSYLDTAMLERGVRAVWHSLVPEGLWIVGRTTQISPPVHHVSVLRKTAGAFELLHRHTEKSEIEDLALAVRI